MTQGNLNFFRVVIRPGESAMEVADILKPDSAGFANYDKIVLSSCGYRSSEPRERKDLVNGPVKVKFVEFKQKRPEIILSMTNELEKPIRIPKCTYYAKIGNVIVDRTEINFKGTEGADIAPGEVAMGAGRFYDIKTVTDFDTNFNHASLSCGYGQ